MPHTARFIFFFRRKRIQIKAVTASNTTAIFTQPAARAIIEILANEAKTGNAQQAAQAKIPIMAIQRLFLLFMICF
ncbi:MAG: hypothetical protein BGO21_20910 [Dyadobacter sp. 50-39]|nr:MAG: hypothetical protein BGO21_20910 [Dyadobacter sp. 50-39]